MAQTVAALEQHFPAIDWREAVTVSVEGKRSRLCCRICIANFGLKASEIESVPYCFDGEADFAAHLKAEHPPRYQ